MPGVPETWQTSDETKMTWFEIKNLGILNESYIKTKGNELN